MRRLFLISFCPILLFIFISCHSKDNAANSPNQIPTDVVNVNASASGQAGGKLPKMVFQDTNFDFGNIKEGDKVTHVFIYKNTGTGDLVISNAIASCGCTKPTFVSGVKHPGDTGRISVTFDSSNKTGKMVKLITISDNCQPPHNFLTINATIQPSNN